MRRDFKPRDYQQAVIEFILARERVNIWSGTGTGKTVSALTSLQGMELVTDPYPALVLAPLRVAAGVWPNETAKWRHLGALDVRSIAGTRDFPSDFAQVDTVNYDNLRQLVDHWGDRWPYRTVIADESTRLKGFRVTQGGKRAQAIGSVAHKRVRHWINLTGTPASNGINDLWGQQWFIDEGAALGRSFDAFERRWFAWKRADPKDPHKKTKFLMPGAQEQIEERLKDCTITVRAGDYMDLPPLIENTILVELPPLARRHYRELQKEMFTKLTGGAEVEAFNAAALTMKCLQAASGALYTDDKGTWQAIHDAKLEALESVIEEAAGAPVLVAYHFKSDLARIRAAFPDAVELRSQAAIDAFSRGEIKIGVGHPASMGHGVDGLQNHCNIGVFFSHWWSLEERLQMMERIGPTRQAQAGKTTSVAWHSIAAKGTVDEQVLRRHETKASVQSLLMAAMRGST